MSSWRWAFVGSALATVVVAMPAAYSDHNEPHVTANDDLDVFNTEVTQSQAETGGITESMSSESFASTNLANVPPTLIPVCEHGGAMGLDDAFGCTGEQLSCEGGLMFTVITHATDGSSNNLGAQCITQSEVSQGQSVDLPGEVLKTFKDADLPESSLDVQPPNGKTLVNLPTIFSTQAPSFTRDVVLDKVGITVELRISADSFTWHVGDGQTLTSTWAGEPWSEGKDVSKLITHTYASVDEDAQVRVDTTWGAQWRVKGTAGWRPVNGTVTVAGQAQELDVLEARPLLVKR